MDLHSSISKAIKRKIERCIPYIKKTRKRRKKKRRREKASSKMKDSLWVETIDPEWQKIMKSQVSYLLITTHVMTIIFSSFKKQNKDERKIFKSYELHIFFYLNKR